MNIQQPGNDISFSLIDRPIEAFITPPNDPLAGLLMDHLPKDCIEIKGNIGGRGFDYSYSLNGNKINIKGIFDNLPLELNGTLEKNVIMEGKLGENRLKSTIDPKNQGPENLGKAGNIDVKEKINIELSTGSISINGVIGNESLHERITLSSDGTRLIDFGNIGDLTINREAERLSDGFHLKGSIGDLSFEEYIIVGKKPDDLHP